MKGIVFPELPYNTNRIYTSAIDKSGCEIFIPAITVERGKHQKKILQNYLNNQPEPPMRTL